MRGRRANDWLLSPLLTSRCPTSRPASSSPGYSEAAEFGHYALTMMIWLAVVGLHRALITEPVIISSGAATEHRTIIADGVSAELLVGVVVSVFVAVGGAAATAAGFREDLLMLALSPWFVALPVQEYWQAVLV